jgi:hypothetical protein
MHVSCGQSGELQSPGQCHPPLSSATRPSRGSSLAPSPLLGRPEHPSTAKSNCGVIDGESPLLLSRERRSRLLPCNTVTRAPVMRPGGGSWHRFRPFPPIRWIFSHATSPCPGLEPILAMPPPPMVSRKKGSSSSAPSASRARRTPRLERARRARGATGKTKGAAPWPPPSQNRRGTRATTR